MREPEYLRAVRQVLRPLASSVGLDFDVEFFRPGNAPVQLAFGFVSCGGILLADLADPEAVPSLDRRISKRVARTMARSFDQLGARQAAVFLAQAYAIDLYELFRFKDGKIDQRYLGFRDLIQEHFPLSDDLVARLEMTRAEYRTLEFHEVREEVRRFEELGTGYSRALLNPAFSQGRDPDADPELVEIQRRYAGQFLRGHAVLTAVELAIGSHAFTGAKAKLIFPGRHDGYDGMVFWLANDARWVGVADGWGKVMKRATGETLPRDDHLDVGGDDPVVVQLRQDIVHHLETDDVVTVPEGSQQALAGFASGMATNEAGWGVATDALVMGYILRVAERHRLPSSSVFDPRNIDQLRDLAAKDRDATLASYAGRIADDMPAPFEPGEGAWSQLSGWASQRALDRDQARRNAGIGSGVPATVTAHDCERAFAVGYGVRFVEEALDDSAVHDLDGQEEPEQTPTFDPLAAPTTDVYSAAVDLLTRTEQLFVELGVHAPIGLMIARVSLKGRYNADEDHPMYGALLAVTLFGYAVRMAQAERAPLPADEIAQIDGWLTRDAEGSADLEAMSTQREGLHEIRLHAAALADDQIRLLALLHIPLQVWTEFLRLATDQLHRNFRDNGLTRRLLPPPEAIENLIRLGCAVRIADEVAGNAPKMKSDLGLK